MALVMLSVPWNVTALLLVFTHLHIAVHCLSARHISSLHCQPLRGLRGSEPYHAQASNHKPQSLVVVLVLPNIVS